MGSCVRKMPGTISTMSVLAGICSCRMGRGSAAEEDAGVEVTCLIYLRVQYYLKACAR